MSETVISSAANASGGCGCKIGAAELLSVLSQIAQTHDERLLVGVSSTDDAAVFKLRDDLAIVQTVDFFPPPVRDPFEFGRIAAANALSDVYAMGGTPLTALNIVCMPDAGISDGSLSEMLRGGIERCEAAGVSIAGGHSIRDDQPKYGLAVTGTIDPKRILSNAGGRVGDNLVLTKPLGTAAVLRGHRDGLATDAELALAVETMATLNREASAQAVDAGANAMTDVTGFGLLGHLHHICRESGLSAHVKADAVPRLAAADRLLGQSSSLNGGTRRNFEWVGNFTKFESGVSAADRILLTEATTSGGLLVALAPGRTSEVDGPVVGELVGGEAGSIRVT